MNDGESGANTLLQELFVETDENQVSYFSFV